MSEIICVHFTSSGKVEMVEAKLENAQRLAKEKQKIVARLGGDTTFKMKTLNDEV